MVRYKMENIESKTRSEQPTGKSVRLHYIDWVRLLATLGVFFYHATRPFGHQEGWIKNDEITVVVTVIFMLFLGPFGMPLFFMMAGASSKFALMRRTGRQFATERIKRVFIPLIVGSILLTPVQVYIVWIYDGRYEGSFLDFIPTFIDRHLSLSLSELFNPTIFETYGVHLWFLGFLFSFSLISLPIFLWLKKDSGVRFIRGLAGLWERRGGSFFFILPILLARLILQPIFPEYTSWSDFVFFLIFFIYGYVIYSDERFMNVVRRDWKLALIVGIASTLLIIGVAAAGLAVDWYSNTEILGFYITWSLLSITGWSWVIVALYASTRILDFRNKWLEYGQEAILPFYVFHQPVIFAISLVVLKWNAGILVKLPLLVVSSFIVTLALVEFIIKRIKLMRALFGMKSRVARSQ